MGGLPDVLFVIDTNKEKIAIAEANKLGIPIVAIIDSNSDPDPIDYPIPGNDDAIRAVNFYCELVANAVLDGIQTEMQVSGVDVGASEVAPVENLPELAAEPAVAAAPEAPVEAAPVEAEAAAEPEAAAEAPAEETPVEAAPEPEASAEAPTEEAPAEAAPAADEAPAEEAKPKKAAAKPKAGTKKAAAKPKKAAAKPKKAAAKPKKAAAKAADKAEK